MLARIFPQPNIQKKAKNGSYEETMNLSTISQNSFSSLSEISACFCHFNVKKPPPSKDGREEFRIINGPSELAKVTKRDPLASPAKQTSTILVPVDFPVWTEMTLSESFFFVKTTKPLASKKLVAADTKSFSL